jgi:cytochrome b561
MQVKPNAPERYSSVAVVLHYVLAIGLIALFGFGLYMADLPFSPTRLKLFNWHKWAGISILVLSALRLIWRWTHPAPALPASTLQKMPGWQVKVHDWTQIAFYVLFFVTPLIGWAYTSAAGFPVVLFGQFPLPDFVSPDKAVAALIKPFHKFSAFALAGLVVLHLAAVLKHQFIDRDGLLKRMSLRS